MSLINITRINPKNGTINDENVTIKIYGNSFTQNMRAYIHDEIIDLSNTTITSNMIQIVVPQLSYVGDNDIQLKIPNNDSSSNILTFCVAPKIASLSKTSGPVCGTTLTIYGYGFDTNSTAYLDDNELIITNRQVNTQIQELQVIIPAANYVGVTYLRVKTANILSSNNSTQFSYIAPAIASISTTRGDIDKTTTITITGTNFGSTTRPDNLYVIIDNYTISSVDVTYISTTQLTAKLPKLPEVSVQIGESNIFVNIGSIKSNPIKYIYLPTLISIDPSGSFIGDCEEITIRGYGFYANTVVTFGSVRCQSMRVVNTSTILAKPPTPKIPGTVTVSLSVSNYNATNTLQFTYFSHRLDNLVPYKGYVTECNQVTLNGFGLHGKIRCNVGSLHIDADNTERTKYTFLLENQPNNDVGSFPVNITKNNITSNTYYFTYLTKIVDISPKYVVLNVQQTIYVKVYGTCKIETTNIKLRLYSSSTYVDISASAVSVVENNDDNDNDDCMSVLSNDTSYKSQNEQCHSKETNTEKCHKDISVYSILTFQLPIQTNPINMKTSLYIDDFLSDSSIIYYISPIAIYPEKIVVNEPVYLELVGSYFTSVARLLLDNQFYNYSEQTDTILRFSLPPFVYGGFKNATLLLNENISIPLQFFVHPKINYIDYPEDIDMNESIITIFLNGSGFSPDIIYNITINGYDCEYSHVSDKKIRVILSQSIDINVDNQFIVSVNDITNNTEIVIYETNFIYSISLTNIEPSYQPYSSSEQTAKLYGNDFSDNTVIEMDGSILDSSKIIDKNSTSIEFITPPSSLSKVSRIYTITDSIKSSNYVRYIYSPTITSFTIQECAVGAVGVETILKGYRLKTYDANDTIVVSWNGDEITNTVVDKKQIMLQVPSSNYVKTVDVYVVYQNIISNTIQFAYKPILDGLSHTSGYLSGGNIICLFGKGFNESTILHFGPNTILSTSFLEYNETTIKFEVPPCTINPSEIKIKVTVNDIESINELSYFYKIPLLHSISKNMGVVNGGDEITVYGEGFFEDIELLFGSHVITKNDFIYNDQNMLTFITPRNNDYGIIKIQLRAFNMLSTNTLSFKYVLHSIDSIYPDHGIITGGDEVIISGEGLSTDVEIIFGGITIPCDSSAVVVNPKYIKFKVPPYYNSGIVNIRAKLYGKLSENILKYQYYLHSVTSISPDTGRLSGGEQVTVYGTGFTSNELIVCIGTTRINTFLNKTSTSVTFIMPSGTMSGKYEVYVIVNDVQSTTKTYYYYLPHILSLSQNNVHVNTSKQITITGEGFSRYSIVKIGDKTISNPLYNETYGTLTFMTPLFDLAQTVSISVVIQNISTNLVNFTIKPKIKHISPNPWVYGETKHLFIHGEGFSKSSQISIFQYNKSILISPTKITTTTIEINIPIIGCAGEIKIGISNDLIEWEYYSTVIQPKITRLSDCKGSILGNNKIFIYGNGFSKNMRVKIDDSFYVDDANVEYINTTTYSVVLPPSNTLKEIFIALTTHCTTTNYISYIYSPFIKTITPNWSPLNTDTQVVIRGDGFTDKYSVYLNRIQLSPDSLQYNYDDNSIIALIPGKYEVTKNTVKVVIEYNGEKYDSANTVDFLYAPSITSISPESSSVTNQETMTIYGNGFTTNTYVMFGTIKILAENIELISSSELSFQIPVVQKQGIYNVRVVTNSTPSAIPIPFQMSAEYSSIDIPITGAPTSGGPIITVYGAGFTDELDVLYNGISVLYNLVSANSLTFILPESVVGSNTMTLKCDAYLTNLTIALVCSPTISYMTQEYNSQSQSTKLTIYGSGYNTSTRIYINDISFNPTTSTATTLVMNIANNGSVINPSLFVYTKTSANGSLIDSIDNSGILYTNKPVIFSANKTSGSVAGNDEIIVTGAGFYDDAVIKLFDANNTVTTIIPSVVYSNQIRFFTPSVMAASIVRFTVYSNNLSADVDFSYSYSPYLHALSKSYCQVGESLALKIFGEGFEKYDTELFMESSNLGTYTFTEYVNDKIVEGLLTTFEEAGVAEIYARVSHQYESVNRIYFEVKPIILSVSTVYANANGGNVEIKGVGITDASSVSFSYKSKKYTFDVDSECCGCYSSRDASNTIVVEYDSIPELLSILEKNNNQALPIDLVVYVNGASSLPYKWHMKNITRTPEIDNEITKILYMCNQFLISNFLVTNYNVITPNSQALRACIQDAVTTIYQLPGTYLNDRTICIFINALMNIVENTNAVTNRAVKNMVTLLSNILLYKLELNIFISPTRVILSNPLLINATAGNYSDASFNYYFQGLADSISPLSSKDLSECISYRVMNNNNVEFRVNEHLLLPLCVRSAGYLLKTRFVLCNNGGKFVGTDDYTPDGTIAELFLYKLTSSLIHHPYQTSSILDLQLMKQRILDNEYQLGTQLYTLLKNKSTLMILYNQFVRDANRVNSDSMNMYIPMPFKTGDRVQIPLLIGSSLDFIDPTIKDNNDISVLFPGSCDPDGTNTAFEYLLDNVGTTVRSTNDLYEVTIL